MDLWCVLFDRVLLIFPRSCGSGDGIFRDIYDYKLQLNVQDSSAVPDRWNADHLTAFPPALEDPVYCCCYLAAVIFWSLVDDRARSVTSITKLNALVNKLKASLALTDDEMWLRHALGSYSWVCITGAAAAPDSGSRIWFHFKQALATRALDKTNDSSLLDDMWAHFTWLRQCRLKIPAVG